MSRQATVTYRLHATVLAEPEGPLIRVDRSAYLPCGCTAHTGHILHGSADGEPAVALVPCRPRHHDVIARARLEIRKHARASDLLFGSGQPVLIEACARALERAWSKTR